MSAALSERRAYAYPAHQKRFVRLSRPYRHDEAGLKVEDFVSGEDGHGGEIAVRRVLRHGPESTVIHEVQFEIRVWAFDKAGRRQQRAASMSINPAEADLFIQAMTTLQRAQGLEDAEIPA